ncbi:MAG TPA: hypothetical protein ENJ09_13270 [Planctomycetes bacterium]|nr:hypothetical protein [Planctomycetota bacterium]
MNSDLGGSGPRPAADGLQSASPPQGPRAFLDAVLEGDPYEVLPTVKAVLRERALLLDGDRVAVRAFALLARERARNPERTIGARRVLDLVHRAVDQLVEEEAGDLWSSRDRAGDDTFSRFAVSLGLDADSLVLARARFHRLDLATREAFLHLVLEGRPLESLVHRGDRQQLLRRAREALDVFRDGLSTPGDSPPPETHPLP